MSKGYVYAARVPGERNVKIGMTKGLPEKRLRQLNNTSVLNDFEFEFLLPVSAARDVERAAHEILANCRSRDSREFFRCSPRRARSAIKRAASGVKRSNPALMSLGMIVNSVRHLAQQLVATFLTVVGVLVTALLLFLLYVDPLARGHYFNFTMGFLVVSLMMLRSGLSLMRR